MDLARTSTVGISAPRGAANGPWAVLPGRRYILLSPQRPSIQMPSRLLRPFHSKDCGMPRPIC